MAIDIIAHQKQYDSPFDEIRHLDKNENEFWYARELMSVLGYQKWQKFKGVIDNAIENIETLMSSTVEHFLPVEVKSQGRPALDYKLSRLACYHVALSCDSRGNDSVKAAKHYFAVKTREAETVIPTQSDRICDLEDIKTLVSLEPGLLVEYVQLEQEREKTKQMEIVAGLEPRVAVELLRLEYEKERSGREKGKFEREEESRRELKRILGINSESPRN